MSELGSYISARLSAARATEAGIAGSGWFTKLDAALHEKLRVRAATNAVLHKKKANMLLVDGMEASMLRVLEDLFPSYNKVQYTLYSTFGSDIEALRAAVYTSVFDNLLVDGRIIHVGGFQDTHVVHGRHVHCEQVVAGPMEYARAVRRYCVTEQLYRDAVAVKKRMGVEKLPWDMLPVLSDAEHSCADPTSCTLSAEYMLFDVNVIPLTQQQVCASMVQHKCMLAEAILLVEEGSLVGGSGYITGSKVRAEFNPATGMIEYKSDQGGSPEFPQISKRVLLEWLVTTAAHWYGSTFTFEILQYYGPFVRVQITRVCEILPMEVTHRIWDMNAGRTTANVRVVKVPRLVDLSISPDNPSNYVDTQVVISEKTYKAAHEYALALTANDFKRANIRRKLNELNNRIIVKGTLVEIVEPLHPEVADVVATELYVKCYLERYDTSQTFKRLTSVMSQARVSAGTGNIFRAIVGKAMAKASDWWSDTVADNIRIALDKIIAERSLVLSLSSELREKYAQHTTTLTIQDVKGRWWRTALPNCGGYFLTLLSLRRPQEEPVADVRSNVGEDDSSVAGSDSGDTGNVSEDFHSDATDALPSYASRASACEELFHVQQHSMQYRQANLASDDEYDCLPDANVVLSDDMETVLAEANIRADMGCEDQSLALRAERVELVVSLDDSEMQRRARCEVGDYITAINEQYSCTFPHVAAADMSADYDLAAHGQMNYTMNVPFLRLPQDNIVGAERSVYKSRLNGPNRPDAPSDLRNLTTGMVKRNADPNVIKTPQVHDISRLLWENFLDKRCRQDARQLLAEYKLQPIFVAYPNLMRWHERVGPEKVARVVQLFETREELMMEYSLHEFLLQFKGKVKPTLSANAHRAYAKFQTIMHYTTEVNMFWSAMFADLTARYNALLLPHIHIGVRGNDADKRDHVRKHHPWGAAHLVYVQLDMSEYDKSQDIRAREFFDIMHHELGMCREYVDAWSSGQVDNVARSMALGVKLIVPLQMKSGIGTTLWGNTAYAQAIAAWLMPEVVYEMGQGDDLYDVLEESKFAPDVMTQLAAGIFNMPVKLIAQIVKPMRMGYFCGKFVVYDDRKQEVYLVPDPVKAVESLSRPLALETARFAEMFESFRDRMVAWDSDFPSVIFDGMVSRWYEAPELRATYLIDALITAGKTARNFRELWEDVVSSVK